jgi:hypothetical protein
LRQAQKETVGLATGAMGLGTAEAVRGIEYPAPTLASQGIDKNLAKEMRAFGALSEAQFEEAVARRRQADRCMARIASNERGESHKPTNRKGSPKAAPSRHRATRLSQLQRLHDPDQQARDPVQHQRPPDP